jgi:hypothetical protein
VARRTPGGDLPSQLQQILFDVADGINLHT